ncbi:MAG: Hpt domain-containing protein [Balneola sp.]
MSENIDLTYLEEVTGGSTEIIKQLLELFLNDTPDQIQKLYNNCAKADWDEVRADAHKLKPTFLYVGLKNAHELLAQIEHGARSREYLDKISEMIRSVENEFEKVEPEIRSTIQQLDS